MDWIQLGKQIASTGATLLGGAVGGPGGAKLGGMVAEALGLSSSEPDEIARAIKLDPQAAVKLKAIESEERIKLREIAARQALAHIEADTKQHQTINETMRAELQASDNYRSRWRPTFGYVMAFNMAVMSIAFFVAVGAVIFDPLQGGAIASGFSDMLGSFVTIFSLGLGVLGIQVQQRSKDKRLAAGVDQPGMLEKLGSVLQRKEADH